MKFISAILLSVCLCMSGWSQDVVFSIPVKLSNKTPQFRILGKNKEGIIIYKYGRSMQEVEAYNSNLKLRWKKTLTVKYPDPVIKKILIYPEMTLMFFQSQSKEFNVFYAEKLSAKFTGNNEVLPVDTFFANRYEMAATVKVIPSQNQSHITVYYSENNTEQVQLLRMAGLDKDLKILFKTELDINTLDGNLLLKKVITGNDGNVYLLMEDSYYSKRKNAPNERYIIKKYETETGKMRMIPFDFQQPVFKDLKLEVDNVNNRLVATGLYGDKASDEAMGFFFYAYNLTADSMEVKKYHAFPKSLIFDITGKDSTEKVEGFFSFEINEVVMRFDGGAIIAAESKFDNEENYQVPSFTPSVGPSFRTVNVSYYNDVMVLALGPNGEFEWSSVLKKKQVSEDDDGFFSSFCMIPMYDKVRFIYNEEIYHKTNVSEYIISKDGSQKRNYLFNSGEKNVLLVPRLGKQVSSSEIVAPSYRRNYLSLVKFSY